ncbi:MAG: potassium channel family protein [Rhodospirillaceae bacterium]|nr:potassium channel family protein [Rhodospirillaceae bacterium]
MSTLIMCAISPTRLIATCLKNGRTGPGLARFLVCWLYSWFFGVALLCLLLAVFTAECDFSSLWLAVPLIVVAWSRNWEIVIGIFHDSFRSLAGIGPASALNTLQRVRLAMLNYVELAMHCAILYYFIPVSGMFKPALSGFFEALYFSGVTITTLGYGDVTPEHLIGRLVVLFEVFSGLLILLFAISVYVGRYQRSNHLESMSDDSNGNSS